MLGPFGSRLQHTCPNVQATVNVRQPHCDYNWCGDHALQLKDPCRESHKVAFNSAARDHSGQGRGLTNIADGAAGLQQVAAGVDPGKERAGGDLRSTGLCHALARS